MSIICLAPQSPPWPQLKCRRVPTVKPSKPLPKKLESSRLSNRVYHHLIYKAQNIQVRQAIHKLLQEWDQHCFYSVETYTPYKKHGVVVITNFYRAGNSSLRYKSYAWFDDTGRLMMEPQFIDLSQSSRMSCVFFPVSYLHQDYSVSFHGLPATKAGWNFIQNVTTDGNVDSLQIDETQPSKTSEILHHTDDDVPVSHVQFNNNQFVQLESKRQRLTSPWMAYGYKSTWVDGSQVIVKLAFSSDCIISKALGSGGKCRANRAKVLALAKVNQCLDVIQLQFGPYLTKSYACFDSSFSYPLGEWVQVAGFDMNFSHECSAGIHFFFEPEPAIAYGGKSGKIINLQKLLDIDDVYDGSHEDTVAYEEHAAITVTELEPNDKPYFVSSRFEKPKVDEDSHFQVKPQYLPEAVSLLRNQYILKRQISHYKESTLLDALDLEFDPKLKHISYQLHFNKD